MESKIVFARVQDFTGARECRVLDFQKVKAEEVGSKYADAYGNTYRLTFEDRDAGGEIKVLEVPSFMFFNDFKYARLRSGDECLISSVLLNDKGSGKNYRRWIFHKLYRDKIKEDGNTAHA